MNLKSMTLPELTAAIKELGQPAFRGKQVYTWLHKGVRSYEASPLVFLLISTHFTATLGIPLTSPAI